MEKIFNIKMYHLEVKCYKNIFKEFQTIKDKFCQKV